MAIDQLSFDPGEQPDEEAHLEYPSPADSHAIAAVGDYYQRTWQQRSPALKDVGAGMLDAKNGEVPKRIDLPYPQPPLVVGGGIKGEDLKRRAEDDAIVAGGKMPDETDHKVAADNIAKQRGLLEPILRRQFEDKKRP